MHSCSGRAHIYINASSDLHTAKSKLHTHTPPLLSWLCKTALNTPPLAFGQQSECVNIDTQTHTSIFPPSALARSLRSRRGVHRDIIHRLLAFDWEGGRAMRVFREGGSGVGLLMFDY